MKKWAVIVFLLCFTLVNLLPFAVLAAVSSEAPDKPYEKAAAKSGRWYTEPLAYNGKTNLVVGYVGSYENSGLKSMDFETGEKIVLSGIYIPVVGAADGDIILTLKDAGGNVYQGFTVEKQKTGGLKETNESGALAGGTTCIFTPEGDIVLPKGHYTLSVEGAANLTGAFLVKGFHFGAYEKHRQALLEWELENNPTRTGQEKTEQFFGAEGLGEDSKGTNVYGAYLAARPPIFALDQEYQIDEIIVSTYNDRKGAAPGTISIVNQAGKVLHSGQAYGVNIENIANGAWKVAPAIVLPPGTYSLALSQPRVLSYDQAGEPLFYVKASLPVQLREDFTGTYRINLDAYKTSTLQGKVTAKNSSFSLKDFELTVLDKGDELELIGQYEELPFSQRCEIVEERPDRIVARFDFDADLSKLPYKAKVGAKATVTLTAAANGTRSISMDGVGLYDRAASAEKGADHNTYSLKAMGTLTHKELPPFVMTALGKAGSAGNIPGPDNATQAVAGILFPPLVGVAVSVLQEMLKPKVPVRRDKNWYKKKYPGKTDEQLAMIMLADAMGNTDNPDEGDAVSVGDNEGGSISPPSSAEGYAAEEYEEESETSWEPEPEPEPEMEPEPELVSELEQPEPQAGTETEQPEQEPETMVVQTSANGAQTLYVKDPKTGEWVDPETNSVLDVEKHGEALERMKQEKEWSDAEFEKSSAGESGHDKALRQSMKEIQEKEERENYSNTLRSKYGTDDLGKIADIVAERQQRAAEWADTWRRNDKILGVMEVGAVAVGTAADVGIDGLAAITPGGTKIRAGYKVLKGVAGTMAEAGAAGKDMLNLGNVAEGAIKGGADAALDYIPGGDGLVGGAMSYTAKASLTTAGEAGGSAVGAALRGEDVNEALTQGLKNGAYKAAVGAITDTVAGDLPNPVVSRGSFKAVPNLKNVIVSRPTGIKIGSALVDEYGIKPIVTGD